MEGPRLIEVVEAGTWSESLYSRFLNRSCRHFEAHPCRVDLYCFLRTLRGSMRRCVPAHPSLDSSMLIKNPAGNYAFLKGISPYSAGAVAEKGYAIEHVRLHGLPPLRRGFEVVEGYLKSIGRPKTALCGIELRSPRPFS